MLCERCKIREANIQYTEVINGVKTEHNYCAQCAREMDFGPYSAIFDSDFPLGKLLSGLLGVGEDHEEEKAKACQVVCPTCKTSYEEFVKNSRFGCPDCYGVFDVLISENIKQLQGSDTHKGKRPKYHYEDEAARFAAGQIGDGADRTGVDAAGPDAAGAGASGGDAGGAVAAGIDSAGASGAVLSEADMREQLSLLDARLHEALAREEYEAAAQYRDKIRELKKGIGEC